jgi:NAD(P)-dependent dehydrogenase (short-subunit alcohol dehydrogenase family)
MKLEERHVLVVGASSGVGRDIGEALARQGARVAFAGRRAELAEEAAREAGDQCLGLACDVRQDDACREVVDRTIDAFGQLDTLVYAAAVGPLVDLQDADGPTWRWALDTNVIGASLVTRAAVPALEKSGAGTAIFLSSISGTSTPAWPGLNLYTVSKAALERLVEGWRSEHPNIRFSTICLGPIASRNPAPHTFGDSWNPEKAGPSVQRWISLGLMGGGTLVDSAELCQQVTTILTSSASFSRVILEPERANA